MISSSTVWAGCLQNGVGTDKDEPAKEYLKSAFVGNPCIPPACKLILSDEKAPQPDVVKASATSKKRGG